MNELFELLKQPEIIRKKCDCRTRIRGGQREEASPEKQPTVELLRSIDPRYFSGACMKCSKIMTHFVGENK